MEKGKKEEERSDSPVMSPERNLDSGGGKSGAFIKTDKRKSGADADYNPYFSPPDINISEIHGRVSLAGSFLNVFDLQDEQFREKHLDLYTQVKDKKVDHCPCCGKDDNGMKVSLFTDSVDMGRLGTAIPGFFDFSKYLILCMLTSTLIYSIYAMVNYSRINKCGYDTDHFVGLTCGSKWKFYLSWASLGKFKIDTTERILYIVAMVAIYGLKVAYYRKFRKMEATADYLATDITDYSVELRGLPSDCSKLDIIEFFRKQSLKNSKGEEIIPNVQLINFVFKDSQRVLDKDNKIKMEIGQLVQLCKKNNPNSDELEKKIKADFEEANTIIRDVYYTNLDVKKVNDQFTGIAYVSFETQAQKEIVEKQMAVKGFGKIIYKLTGSIRGPFRFFASGIRHQLNPDMSGYFYIERAEPPSEIIFTNLGFSSFSTVLRKTFSFICSLVLITGTFVVIFLLKGTQSGLKSTGTKQTNSPLIVLITVCIKVACFILETLTPILVDFEKPQTFTSRNIGMIWRSSISVFLNSALVVTIANIYYQRDQLDETFYTDNGLANDLLFLLIFSSLEAVFAVVIPGYVVTLFKRFKTKKDGNKSEVLQYQSNEYHEGMPFIYPRRFGKYCNLLLITFFQISVFPYAPLLGAVNLILFMMADRFFLLRLSKLPEYCSTELALSMIRFSDMIFVAWSGGYLVFEIINNNGSISNWTIATFSVALANLIFNPNYILRKIFKFGSNEADEAVTDLKTFLKSDDVDTYRRRNPINALHARLHVYMKPEYLDRCKQNMKDLSIDSASENDSMQQIFKEEVAKEEQMEIENAEILEKNDSKSKRFNPITSDQVNVHISSDLESIPLNN